MSDRVDGGEKLRVVAIEVALKTGLLRKCPIHNEIFDPGQHDYQGACMVATYMVNRADPMVSAFRGDRTPLTQLLKIICQDYGSSCEQCKKAAAVG